jgi:hypothetical protein
MNLALAPGKSRFDDWGRFLLLALGLVGILLVVPVFRNTAVSHLGDSYIEFAQHWRQSGRFPDTHFGPVYIVFVSAFVQGIPHIRMILGAQVLLSLATAWFVYRIAWRLQPDRSAAMVVTALWLVSPLRIIYQGLILTESLYLFLVFLGLLLWLQSGKNLMAAAAALVFSVAALTRGNCLVLAMLLFLYMLKDGGWRRFRPYLFVAVFSVPILLMSWSNYLRYQAFEPTSSGDYNIAMLMVSKARGEVLGVPSEGNPAIWILPGETFANKFQEARVMRERAMAFARQHPYLVLRTNVVGWSRTMVGCGIAQWGLVWGAAGKAIAMLGGGFRMALYGIALVWALLALFRTRSGQENLLLFLFAALVIAHIVPSGAEGYSRSAMPVDPVAGMVAVFAIQKLKGSRSTGRVATSQNQLVR